ncbi:DUF4919 domain-containing protein [Marixanthomonas sp. SCSIO 43207]|uniref:DUF4919 domain-containing protein n=1 Tax=Marixanthomonas sp. SCSIO 43207 TaxID=2779360 RepID=UPI001CA82401|nr:DUF4919 domain-containing protein [Marixanthomonas sp. SCSIO 43207]UAB80604.1 DUF4919 domain-containing protein [Marixanthomonas sp. SCSIO 43207]
MKKIYLIVFIFVSSLSYSQDWYFEKPNYTVIKKNIKKKKSNLFYESLMNKFQNADSTMTLEEKRHLYYGYIYDENYSPYSRSDFGDSLRVVLQKEKLDSLDLIRVVDFTDKMLLDNPFDLNAINYQLYSLEQIGDKITFNKKVTQLRIIVDALMSSGNGKSKKEAFYVIYTSHEYNLLNILGFQFGGSQSLIEHYDYLTLAENEAELEGLYFDVSPCLNSMSKMFKE